MYNPYATTIHFNPQVHYLEIKILCIIALMAKAGNLSGPIETGTLIVFQGQVDGYFQVFVL